MSTTDDDSEFVAALLNDPSMWFAPEAASEQVVIDSIRAERAVVVPLRSRRRWAAPVVAGLLGAAAAAAVTVVLTNPSNEPGLTLDDGPKIDASADLVGSDLAAGFTGTAQFSNQRSGVLVRIWVPGLPRRDDGKFYEGWLRSCDGERFVPIGTFHDMDEAAGWAGVSIEEYPLLSVTEEEVAGKNDVAQTTSGRVVVSGSIAPCP